MKNLICPFSFPYLSRILSRFTSLVAVCAGLLCPSAQAVVYVWNGAGSSGYWSDVGNWSFMVTPPTNGDTLIFPGFQPRPVSTNDLLNLTLNQIRFLGSNYVIYGNSFTITNSIVVTNTAGTDIISLPGGMTLATADITVLVSNSATLAIPSVMSGSVGVIKNGSGILNYDGSQNTYSGTTTVNGGTLELGCGALNAAFGGPLVINSGGTVLLTLDKELPIGPPITVNSGGILNLNNFDDSIGTSLTLNGNGSVLNANPLNLSANATVTANPGVIFLNPTISGSLNVNSGICTFDVINAGSLVGSLVLPASVSGSATINKTGVGFMSLSASNSFTGQLNVAGGALAIANPFALGTTAGGTTVSNTATLWIQSASVTNEPLTIASTGIGIENASGANTWAGPITLAAQTTMQIDGVSLDLHGVIGGPGGFTKTSPGTLRLTSGGNLYAGNTTVNTGVLELNGGNVIRFGTLTIGDGIGGANADVVRYVADYGIYGGLGGCTVVINNTGLLDLNGFYDDVGPIIMDGGTINTGAGDLSLFPPLATVQSFDATNGDSTINGNLDLSSDQTNIFAISNNLVINAVISDPDGDMLVKTGTGQLFLSGANTYTGPTLIQQGYVWAENNLALGATNGDTEVSSGATLVMQAICNITNEALTINGPGEPEYGALDVESGIHTWAGPITNNANSTLDSWGVGSELHIRGPISGAGGLELFNGVTFGNASGGTEFFEGSAANTYAGLTTVDQGGVLVLGKTTGIFSVPGNLFVNNGATARLTSSDQVTHSADVFVDAGGLFDFSTFYSYMNTLHGTGTVNFGVNGYLIIGANSGTSEFDGVMTGTGYTLGGYTVGKFGNGTFTMGGNNTFTAGATHVFSPGKLVINGSEPQVPAIVDNGATLGGSGTVGFLAAAGSISPGNSPGILTSSNLTFTSSGNFSVELTGPNPGIGGYDQLNVRGTNNLANASLTVIPAFTTPVALGQQFVIINNDLADPITGTFNGLPQGSTITAGNYKFMISYIGGTGNDVVLTLTSIPGAVIGSAVTSGDGNHAIDPNDCNSLYLVITNKSGSPMTGISATLSAATPGVIITQPDSAYTNIATGGTGANTTPFQISTLPDFVCGTVINLQLSVNSSIGSFTMNFALNSGQASVAPSRYDVTGNVAIPDIGTVDSTNVVSGFTGLPLQKVVVSLYITHQFDSDLTNISLISPDGTTVLLSSANGGGGQNYGSGLTPDSDRTTFDDAATTPITSGTAPFVGTFRPQSPLSAFIGNATPNGNWHLHVADGFGGSLGTLRGWSLFLYGTACTSGSGQCDLCPNISFTTATGPSSPLQTGYVSPNGTNSTCGVAKACPGTVPAGPYPSENFTFQNGPTDACITVTLENTNSTFGMVAAAYSAAGYNPTNADRCANYLGDAGFIAGVGSPTVSFSFNVASNAAFVVNVVAGGYGPYSLTVSGGDCTPTLDITALPGNQARLDWSSAAGGYRLAATPALNNPSWTDITNEPIVNNGLFNVTNSMTPTNLFYLLHKP